MARSALFEGWKHELRLTSRHKNDFRVENGLRQQFEKVTLRNVLTLTLLIFEEKEVLAVGIDHSITGSFV